MVTVLPARTSLGSELGKALGQGFGGGFSKGLEESMLNRALSDVQQIYADQNMTPEQKQISLYKLLKGHPNIAESLSKNLQSISSDRQSIETDQQRYDTIRQNFGQKAADVYRAAPEGGKTVLLQALMDARQRGINVDEMFGQLPALPGQDLETQVQQIQKQPTLATPEQPPSNLEATVERFPIKTVDYDKGLLPKERIRRQDERYSKNLPLYQEGQKRLQSFESEKDALEILNELSPKISSIQRLNINPQTGELIIPALASPEAQRYVKTINDFTTRAKDSYGARVTNFDLQQYMKRLPTLANSEDGRKQIIRQMQIINEINTQREKALRDIIEEHGGIRNIDFDQAEKLADKISKPQIETLRKEFKTIDGDLEKQYREKIKVDKAKVPKGFIAVEKVDGTQGYIPQGKLKAFLKVKGNKVL